MQDDRWSVLSAPCAFLPHPHHSNPFKPCPDPGPCLLLLWGNKDCLPPRPHVRLPDGRCLAPLQIQLFRGSQGLIASDRDEKLISHLSIQRGQDQGISHGAEAGECPGPQHPALQRSLLPGWPPPAWSGHLLLWSEEPFWSLTGQGGEAALLGGTSE